MCPPCGSLLLLIKNRLYLHYLNPLALVKDWLLVDPRYYTVLTWGYCSQLKGNILSILRSIFGPSQSDIWSQVAHSIGGQFEEGGLLGKNELRYHSGQWELVLDTFVVSTGQTMIPFTRMRAPFVNKDGLYFKIYPEGLSGRIGKFFGMQDIQIGDPQFDEGYMIKGNDELKIRSLLHSTRVKQLIEAQPSIELQIKDDDGLFGASFTEGTDMLYFACAGVVKDPQVLKDLFELFCCVLDRLVEIDSAYESNPDVTL